VALWQITVVLWQIAGPSISLASAESAESPPWERTINHWRLSLPSLEISPGYSRCAEPREKYQKDSD